VPLAWNTIVTTATLPLAGLVLLPIWTKPAVPVFVGEGPKPNCTDLDP